MVWPANSKVPVLSHILLINMELLFCKHSSILHSNIYLNFLKSYPSEFKCIMPTRVAVTLIKELLSQ